MTEINGFPHCRSKKTKEANRTEVHYHLSKRRQEQKKLRSKKRTSTESNEEKEEKFECSATRYLDIVVERLMQLGTDVAITVHGRCALQVEQLGGDLF
jgi:hypothetical protein